MKNLNLFGLLFLLTGFVNTFAMETSNSSVFSAIAVTKSINKKHASVVSPVTIMNNFSPVKPLATPVSMNQNQSFAAIEFVCTSGLKDYSLVKNEDEKYLDHQNAKESAFELKQSRKRNDSLKNK